MKSISEVLNSLFKNKNDEISSIKWTPDFEGLGLEFSKINYES